MKKLLLKIQKKITSWKIQKQLNFIYLIAIVLPIITLGTILVATTSNLLLNYHKDVVESDNLRVKTILFEVTSQIYNISEDIVFDDALQDMLSKEYQSENDFKEAVREFKSFNNYLENYTEIEDIQIYTNMEKATNYQQFFLIDDVTAQTDWYQKAAKQFSVFWYPMATKDSYGNEFHPLSLVRKIPLFKGNAEAVLVIRISDNYLQSRISNTDYTTLVSTESGDVFFGTNRVYYGEKQPVKIDYSNPHYSYTGAVSVGKTKCMASINALSLYQTDTRLYVSTLSYDTYKDINRILWTNFLLVAIAAILPMIIVKVFLRYFSNRVMALREEMHKASMEEYDIAEALPGEDEIAQAMTDLHVMVQNIKQKDSEMYEARINEQTLKNEQQVMEFKMLSSQINPHFLYNTLETIRMKALTEGNAEVATAIKLLGKSLRYVLENTGTSSTTLKKELTHIEIYLIIQKMRFSERVNYEFIIEENLCLEDYEILPLLLQPIVENAINHGLEEVEKYGLVTIRVATKDDEFLLIDIEDNGTGMDEDTLDALIKKLNTPNVFYKSSIGLHNISQRIRLYYGEKYGMTIKSRVGKGTLVSLVLPLKNISEDNK